jgi:chromosome segregation ATPase
VGLTEGGNTVIGMATTEERLGTLEVRVENLDTWAGPGQAGALADGQREIRAELGKIRQTQDRHTRMLADLTADISELKTTVTRLDARMSGLETRMSGLETSVSGLETRMSGLETRMSGLETRMSGLESDMGEVKDTLREILRRLPA